MTTPARLARASRTTVLASARAALPCVDVRARYRRREACSGFHTPDAINQNASIRAAALCTVGTTFRLRGWRARPSAASGSQCHRYEIARPGGGTRLWPPQALASQASPRSVNRRSPFPPAQSNGKDDAMIATTTVFAPSLQPGLRGVREQLPRSPASAQNNARACPSRLTSQRGIDAVAEHVWYLSRVSTAYSGPASLGLVRPRAALILPHRQRR